jgi:hypothetical protein
MELYDTLILKCGGQIVKELRYIANCNSRYLLAPSDGRADIRSLLWIKKKHDIIQLDDKTWELDISEIGLADL